MITAHGERLAIGAATTAFVTIVLIGLAWLFVGGRNYFEDVLSGLVSTGGGLIIGIPVALWIDRVIKTADTASQRRDERRRELELLGLLTEELRSCAVAVAQRQQDVTRLHLKPMKCDLWSAVSNGGKLALISNHHLLDEIASAYYAINLVKNLEEHAYHARLSATVRFNDGRTALETAWSEARKFDDLLARRAAAAINSIESDAKQRIQ